MKIPLVPHPENAGKKAFGNSLLYIFISAMMLSVMIWRTNDALIVSPERLSSRDCGIVFFLIGYAVILPAVYYKNRTLHEAHTNATRIQDKGFALVVLLLFSLLNLALPFLLLLTGDGMKNLGGLAYFVLTSSWLSLWVSGTFFLFASYVSVYMIFCVMPMLVFGKN